MIRVQTEDFDVGHEIEELSRGRHDIGAVASFVGLVRELSEDGGPSAMTLEHYPGMTEKQLEKLEAEALARWPLHAVSIIHRHGRLVPGERIVFCAAAARHRQAAFEACAFLMDWLKTQAPFWKLEEGAGEARWVAARDSDNAAWARWREK